MLEKCKRNIYFVGLTQLRLSSSSTNNSNVNVKKKLAPLEPEGPPIPPEGSYFVKRWPDKAKEGDQSNFSMEKLEEYLSEFGEEFDFDNDQVFRARSTLFDEQL